MKSVQEFWKIRIVFEPCNCQQHLKRKYVSDFFDWDFFKVFSIVKIGFEPQGMYCKMCQMVQTELKHRELKLEVRSMPKVYVRSTYFCAAVSPTDYKRPVRKSPSLHGRKSTPSSKSLGTTEVYFVCQIHTNFHFHFFL